MPYIDQSIRNEIDPELENLIKRIQSICREKQLDPDGPINYAFTKIMCRFFDRSKYGIYERGMGLISCVGHEFYRRRVASYEDEKKAESGDVY